MARPALLASLRGERWRSPGVAGAAWVPDVRTRITFDETRPCRTGRRCYRAHRRYKRCHANPADGPVKFRSSRATTRRSEKSISSTWVLHSIHMFASAISDRGRERFKSSCRGIGASIDRDEARTLQLPVRKNGLKFRTVLCNTGVRVWRAAKCSCTEFARVQLSGIVRMQTFERAL